MGRPCCFSFSGSDSIFVDEIKDSRYSSIKSFYHACKWKWTISNCNTNSICIYMYAQHSHHKGTQNVPSIQYNTIQSSILVSKVQMWKEFVFLEPILAMVMVFSQRVNMVEKAEKKIGIDNSYLQYMCVPYSVHNRSQKISP